MKLSHFNKVYDQYYLLVMKVAFNVLKDYHYAQDVCQEVFAVLYKKAGNIDETLVKAWLLVTAKRKAIDLQRKQFYGKEVCGEGQDILYYKDIRPEYTILTREFESRLFQALKEKDETWFQIVIRVSVEEETPEKVARELGITLSHLRTKLFRARTWIRENFKEDYRELI